MLSRKTPIILYRNYIGPGDIVSGATAFYSLRAYTKAIAITGTQKCVNVRRSSDNATTDIYILRNGNLDIGACLAFAQGSSLFVTKWYDQSGNTRDASQGTAANQPGLVLSGFGTGSRAGLLFSNSFFSTSYAIADTFTIGKVISYTSLGAGESNVDTIRGPLSGNWAVLAETNGANPVLSVVTTAPSQKTITGATSLSTSTLYSINGGDDGSNIRLYTNGTEDANSPVAASGALRGGGLTTTIGYANPGRALAANVGELYVLTNQSGATVSALTTNQRNWYGF